MNVQHSRTHRQGVLDRKRKQHTAMSGSGFHSDFPGMYIISQFHYRLLYFIVQAHPGLPG